MDPHSVSLRHYNAAIQTRNNHIKFMLDEKNTCVWYALFCNLDGCHGEYVGGEYLARCDLPNDFPMNPPSFYLMTPNGLYVPNANTCVSIGKYHSQNYRPVLGVHGFCENIISGLIGWETIGSGMGLVKTTIAEKKRLAKDSVRYNAEKYPELIKKINENHAAYSKKWKDPVSTTGAASQPTQPSTVPVGTPAETPMGLNGQAKKPLRPVKIIGAAKK